MPTGFEFRYCANGGEQIIKTFVVANDEVLSKGELVNLESGELDAGATNDAALVGAMCESLNNADDGLTGRVTINPDAVYAVTDANARLAGATLDMATGAMGVTTSSNVDLIVVETSTATEETLVMIAPGEHFLR